MLNGIDEIRFHEVLYKTSFDTIEKIIKWTKENELPNLEGSEKQIIYGIYNR